MLRYSHLWWTFLLTHNSPLRTRLNLSLSATCLTSEIIFSDRSIWLFRSIDHIFISYTYVSIAPHTFTPLASDPTRFRFFLSAVKLIRSLADITPLRHQLLSSGASSSFVSIFWFVVNSRRIVRYLPLPSHHLSDLHLIFPIFSHLSKQHQLLQATANMLSLSQTKPYFIFKEAVYILPSEVPLSCLCCPLFGLVRVWQKDIVSHQFPPSLYHITLSYFILSYLPLCPLLGTYSSSRLSHRLLGYIGPSLFWLLSQSSCLVSYLFPLII
jgi:hypothetical protein